MQNQYHPLGFAGSRLALGFWRMHEWNMSPQQRLALIEQSLEMGVSTLDHADIYGDYRCESLFGEALTLKPALRENMQLVSKCGIRLPSVNRPDIAFHRYDHSFDHIVASVEQSLSALQTDYLDLLLIHRPSPLMDADEVARAFEHLHMQGKVRHFGVSNFTPAQFDLLQSRADMPLIVNQIELSVLAIESFMNGTLDHMQQHAVTPMAWSPLAGGALFSSEDERSVRVRNALQAVADSKDGVSLDQIALAWLLRHPSGICPVIGSGKAERLQNAVESLALTMTDDQWFSIWVASTGAPVP